MRPSSVLSMQFRFLVVLVVLVVLIFGIFAGFDFSFLEMLCGADGVLPGEWEPSAEVIRCWEAVLCGPRRCSSCSEVSVSCVIGEADLSGESCESW